MTLTLVPQEFLGIQEQLDSAPPLPVAHWYTATNEGDAILYRFPAGSLGRDKHLSADFLLEGSHMLTFVLNLQEGQEGPAFQLIFALLDQIQARFRLALQATDLDRWLLGRQAGWLKPMAFGERVDLAKVDRMRLSIMRKAAGQERWCMTPFTVSDEPAPELADPLLPNGPLIDELGQSLIHRWPTRSQNADEVTQRLLGQLAAAPEQKWPDGFSRWGGWLAKRFDATGWFRTQHDGRRWWLVDPDGYIFWSAGLDCIRPDASTPTKKMERAFRWLPERTGTYAEAYGQEVDYPGYSDGKELSFLAANMIRAFGPEEWFQKWATVALSQLRQMAFNTVGNWSQHQIAQAAGYPYVRPLDYKWSRTPFVYREFVDVFDPVFAEEAAEYAERLRDTADDPALIGYFLMNEPSWAFSREIPATGMLFTTRGGYCRRALADFLRQRHGDDAGLSAAWGLPARLADIAEGEWRTPLTEAAQPDMIDFSEIMVDRLFGGLSAACRKVDPHHLNLGVRYYTVPPPWALKGMSTFDVFSMNCYRRRVPGQEMALISEMLHMPTMIGEFHFGALDAGLPASGIGHVRNQVQRGQAYRIYVEDAATQPSCVGTHWFILYDQSAAGRPDGEAYNIGFVDICSRPYEAMASAARETHARIYQVAAGEVAPFADEPEYLPFVCV